MRASASLLEQRVAALNRRIQRDAKWRIIMGVGWLLFMNTVMFVLAVHTLISYRRFTPTSLGVACLILFALFCSGWYTAWREESPLKAALERGARDPGYNAANAIRIGPAASGMLRMSRGLSLATLGSALSDGQRAILEGNLERRLSYASDPEAIARANRFLDRLARESMSLEEAMRHPDWFMLRGMFLVREVPAGAGKLNAELTPQGKVLVKETTGRVARR